MINRKANAVWKGTGKEGSGVVSTQSTVLENTQYSFNTRFEDGKGTNPEELIAAAHAGCFAMKLSFELNAAGFTADELDATATVSLDPSVGKVTKSHLELKAQIPGISGSLSNLESPFLNYSMNKSPVMRSAKSLPASVNFIRL